MSNVQFSAAVEFIFYTEVQKRDRRIIGPKVETTVMDEPDSTSSKDREALQVSSDNSWRVTRNSNK